MISMIYLVVLHNNSSALIIVYCIVWAYTVQVWISRNPLSYKSTNTGGNDR